MTLTAQHVERVLRAVPGAMSGRKVASLAELAAGANEALLDAPPGLTVRGAAAFLATMSQESDSFRTTQEYRPQDRYRPYTGRTFEQITWESNYRGFGQWCHALGLLADPEAFVRNPSSLAELRWAWLGGVWFWQAKGIWAYGNRGDFLATQRAVNLGSPTSRYTPSGIKDRQAWYDAWLLIGPDLIPAPPADDTEGFPIMATNEAEGIYRRYKGRQPLPPGSSVEVWINEKTDAKTKGLKHDVSLVVGASPGVDLHATALVEDARGRRYTGRVVPDPDAPGGFMLVGVPQTRFRIVSTKAGVPTTTASQRPASASDTAYFGGTIGALKDGFEPRLRFVVETPADAPAGLVLAEVIVQGWQLKP